MSSEGEGPNTLIVVVGVLALILIGAYFALGPMKLIDFANIEWFARQIIVPDRMDTEDYGNLGESGDPTGQRPMTSTEAACDIAKAVREDFVNYGLGSRPVQSSGDYMSLGWAKSGDGSGDSRIVVTKKPFKITWKPGKSGFYNFSDLTQLQKDYLMKTKGCSDDNTEWKCDSEYVDEECVSKALSHLNLTNSLSRMCTAKISVGLLQPEKQTVSFGNNACESNNGKDDCKSYCPGSGGTTTNMINAWRAPDGDIKTLAGSSGGNIIDDDKWKKGNVRPPEQCKDAKCEPKYEWMLIWNVKNMRYEVEIYQVPEAFTVGRADPIALMKSFVPISADPNWGGKPEDQPLIKDINYRSEHAEFIIPELRTRSDVIFRPNEGTPTSLAVMADKLAEQIGNDYVAAISNTYCTGVQDCLGKNALDKKSWRTIGWESTSKHSAGYHLYWDQGTNSPTDNENKPSKKQTINKITVITNIEPDLTGKALKDDHLYRVVMRWWRYDTTSDSKCNMELCDGGCQACLEQNGMYVGLRKNCEKESVQPLLYTGNCIEERRSYQDLSLIVIDLGEDTAGTIV